MLGNCGRTSSGLSLSLSCRRSFRPLYRAALAAPGHTRRFTQRLADAGVAPSTGSVGDSLDNAVAESFFGSLKTELIYRHSWTSRHDAELAIFAWIEGWYNPERIMARLGMRSPDEHEAAFYAGTTNTNLDTTVKVGNHLSSLQ